MSNSEKRESKRELLSKRISGLDEKIDKLNAQRELLQDKLRAMDIQEMTESVLHLITEVNRSNSMEIELHHDSRTTPIMDRFYNSKSKFLILKSAYCIPYKIRESGGIRISSSSWISLIIIKVNSVQGTFIVNKNGLTMTDLKMSIARNSLYPSNVERQGRLSALAKEIAQLDLANYERGHCIPFHNICYLGAQTYQNQTGYGSEYCGEELVHEGTLYGETTGFLIIGVRVES
ncbi:MAG: hypothetical protein J5753_02540 [Oscillospiraceae bacterium]|nr:hypothetical protein [Oscillospiraceae bacterium]